MISLQAHEDRRNASQEKGEEKTFQIKGSFLSKANQKFQMPKDMETKVVSMEEVKADDELSLVVSTGKSKAIFSAAIAEKWGTRKLIVRLNRTMNNNMPIQLATTR